MISKQRFLTALIVAAAAVCQSVAYTLRQIDNTDGLSNSAVLSLAQDETGRLWIGTCDGLNLFDGREVTFFGRTPSEPRPIRLYEVRVHKLQHELPDLCHTGRPFVCCYVFIQGQRHDPAVVRLKH